ncbi:demethylmenaquinone methyltransferase / 2-methoxy-6-polyprenyl-1,4-benzoquinol methylase [Pelosinus propionicus DSM 13327]|uniref:Demethylmenaquinone methyltransferase n=2 Tax=Pelosinus TaxID=365348 RepID=A0A1I4LYJ4_9FIRM|nr:demethylmenaquinone methyltransferase / 2-methoxy-6-polyprenyl-1,4-benzoquinol methylase [Pelosinus propionicus DSM 13327]
MEQMDKHRREDFVQELFDSIAKRYDLFNAVLTLNQDSYWRSFAVNKAYIKTGQSILDVCCGTGKLSIALAEKAGRQGQIVGLDFSETMLQQAKENIRKTPYSQRITLLQGNALHLPFSDQSFDCTTIGFGLRNVADIAKALSEMYRVTKSGGTVLSVELSKPSAPMLKQLYFLYFEHLLPLIGNLGFKKNQPYYNLPASLRTLPDHSEIQKLFLQVGLKQVTSYQLTGGIAAVHLGIK